MARSPRRPGNLPAEATSFVGRRRELTELRKTLSTARLVSLVGPGGVGKTRLAIRIATDLARGFTFGAWLVDLAEIQDPALVPNAVLAALDLRNQSGTPAIDVLVPYVREREMLLVVDNCEHLLTASVSLVTEIIEAAPKVRVLTTTREPLSVSGEHVVAVPPLELPAPDDPLGRLQQNEAVALFIERAAGASGRFQLTGANQAAVVDLCRRLDGLPLAIELAAVRIRVLSPEQILERLTDRFALLTGGSRAALPRHQTLRTTIDWSYDLLSEAERTLLQRLSVFAGSFEINDVEAVCVSPALDELSSLLDKSLVVKEDVGRVARYRLHETMREYTRLKLREIGGEDSVYERYVDYYVSTCTRSIDEGHDRFVEWLSWYDAEIDNIRAVLHHCQVSGDSARGAALAGAAAWFWITRGTSEGVRWLDLFLGPGRGDPAILAHAYFVRGFLATVQVDAPAAESALTMAVALARQAGRPRIAVQALASASIACDFAGDPVGAKKRLSECEAEAAKQQGDPLATVALLQARSNHAFVEGDLEAALSASSESVAIARESGLVYNLEYGLTHRGFALMLSGDPTRAEEAFGEALRIARQIDDRLAEFYLLIALASLAGATSRPRLAAQLMGAAEAVRLGAGAKVGVELAPLLAQTEEAATAELGSSRFAADFMAGKEMSRDAAIGLALGEKISLDVPAAGEPALLGKREADVANLVAEGLSNKQIGARLFISERTVESHVRNILNKLGFNSRAQIASWVGSARL